MTTKNFKQPDGWAYNSFKTASGHDIRYGSAEPDPDKFPESKGTVVVTGGYGRHIEYYYEAINNWLNRGYTVYAMDWHGQGGSGRENPDRPELPPTYGFENHVGMFHEFVQNVVKPDPMRPAFLSTHSMGGNIIMRYLQEHENDPDFPFDAAVMGAPLIDIGTTVVPRGLFRRLVNFLDEQGADNFSIPSLGKAFEDAIEFLTDWNREKEDKIRDRVHEGYKQETEEYAIGFPTVGWLKSAFNSAAVVNDKKFLSKIKTPVLILTAGNDALVSKSAQEDAAKSLPRGQQIFFDDAKHGIWYDHDDVQYPMWRAIDRFIHGITRAYDAISTYDPFVRKVG